MNKQLIRVLATTFFTAYTSMLGVSLAEAASEIPVQEKNVAYEQACASCHMIYAPSTLPARSWEKIMQGLENHFGDDAEVDQVVRNEVSDYLQRNAADKVDSIYALSMLKLLKADETPLRISETKYFKLKHDIVKKRMVEGNPDVKSVARCEVCHHAAIKGDFNRFEVRIPHYYRKSGRFVYFPTL